MKKLVVIALLAAFAVACAQPGLEDYETELEAQAIEHSEVGDEEDDDEKYMDGHTHSGNSG